MIPKFTGYYFALLRLDAVNGVRPVLTFLAILGTLFALYAAAYWLVRGERRARRSTLLLIAAGAVLFRLTLLPAGLPPQDSWAKKLNGLRADVQGQRVAYERFLLFDGDIWRYLWDGHVGAHGVNPYLHAPADAAPGCALSVVSQKLQDLCAPCLRVGLSDLHQFLEIVGLEEYEAQEVGAARLFRSQSAREEAKCLGQVGLVLVREPPQVLGGPKRQQANRPEAVPFLGGQFLE